LSHIQGWEWVEIDQILEDLWSQNDIPGLVFGFVNGSQSVAKGYGLSDISISKPMDNSTRVFIASISKVKHLNL
jgi:CubicO group peptidase (beta-lactamase class C family)